MGINNNLLLLRVRSCDLSVSFAGAGFPWTVLSGTRWEEGFNMTGDNVT